MTGQPFTDRFVAHAREHADEYAALATPQPRQQPCTHPVRRRLSLDQHVVREVCRICDTHLTTDRRTGATTTEVQG